MDSKNKAYIKIHDFDCSVDEITKALEIQPTDSWIKGDLIPGRKGNIRRRQSTWEYQSVVDTTEPIEKHVGSLLERFKSKKDILKLFSKKYYTELTLVIYEYEHCNPGFLFENKVLTEISELGLTIDVDIYVLLE